MRHKLTELAGWYGVLAVLIAFTLNSFAVVSAQDEVYQILNITGAVGIIVSSYLKKDYQPVVLNVIWLCIALVALVGIVGI